ncbi:MAG: hypothetical protein FJ279_12265, partial [Planctomycetes bacterium]|nr:hypothetical protein [Planctomycetota bacterium]
MDDFLAKQRETQESDTGGGFFVRQAVVWGGCVGLLYGATDVLQMIFKEKTSLFEHVAAQTPYIGLMLLGYAAVHALALAAWTGCLVWAHRLRRVAFSRERWVRVGFGGFVGFAAWLIALNLAGICVEREALKHWREGLSDRTLRDGCLVVWTFVAAGAVGWGAVRGFGALESLRKAAVARMRAKVVRRAFALVAAVAIVSVFVVQVVMPMASRHAAKRNKHNVLLITVDTLRPDYLSCGGSSKVRTEHLDALANGGVLFETVISHAPWTRPSVATLLTGRYPSVHDAGRTVVAKGRLQDPMHGVRRSVPMLAEMLSAAHFTTQAFVTNAHLREEFGFGRGFGDFYHFDVGAGTKERSRYARRFERAILLDGLSRHLRLYPLRDAPELVIPPRPDKPERSAFPDSAEDVVTTASDWLAQFEARREGRFFLWLHFMDAHEYAAYHAVPQGAAENERPFAIRAFPEEEDREHATV